MSELCVIVNITGGDIRVVVYDIHYAYNCYKISMQLFKILDHANHNYIPIF